MPDEDRPDVPEMTVAQLKAHMDERFGAVDARFDAIDARFAGIDNRFVSIDERFDALEKRLVEEGEATRRHFDVVAERLKGDLRLFAEGYQGNYERLEDHERRISALEKRQA